MNWTEILGYFAATATTLSFVPQVWQTWKTRDTSGISLLMYSMFWVGIAAWLGYGILAQTWPVVVANAVTLVLAGVILVLKILEKK